MRTPKKCLKESFLLLPTCIKRTRNQIPPPNMPDTGNAKDYFELPPTTFSVFTLKNVTWRTYLISFTVQYCFLFRFVCIELVSLIWFLQTRVSIYIYGTMINWSTLITKLMQMYIVIVSGSILNVSTVNLNGIWHLIKCYLSKPVLGRHPVLSGHYSIPRGCPLNTGFTVLVSLESKRKKIDLCIFLGPEEKGDFLSSKVENIWNE